MLNDCPSERRNYDFGWWPELAGLLIGFAIMAFLFGFADGAY